MKFETLQVLIDEFKKLPCRKEQEENIFSVGARGHYENPTSDLLAFFIDPSAAHGMGDKVLQALLNCIKEEHEQHIDIADTNLVTPPQREQSTDNSKRIDLLLESESWVMLIENKIYHHLDNPLDTYKAWADRTYENKTKILLVLSIEGTTSENWIGVSWKQFLDEVKKVMADAFLFGQLSKWHVLLREYILHLESIVSPTEYTQKEEEFFFDNLNNIKEIIELRKSIIDSLQKEIVYRLENEFKTEITARIEYWSGFPALRFHLKKWRTESDLVLCLAYENGKKFHINVHTYINNDDFLTRKADGIMRDSTKVWSELKNTYRCFYFGLADYDKPSLIEEVINKARLLDCYEIN